MFSFKNKFNAYVSSSEANDSKILNPKSFKHSFSDNTHEILLDNICKSDIKFFDTDIHNIDNSYFLHEEFESCSCKLI